MVVKWGGITMYVIKTNALITLYTFMCVADSCRDHSSLLLLVKDKKRTFNAYTHYTDYCNSCSWWRPDKRWKRMYATQAYRWPYVWAMHGAPADADRRETGRARAVQLSIVFCYGGSHPFPVVHLGSSLCSTRLSTYLPSCRREQYAHASVFRSAAVFR